MQLRLIGIRLKKWVLEKEEVALTEHQRMIMLRSSLHQWCVESS